MSSARNERRLAKKAGAKAASAAGPITRELFTVWPGDDLPPILLDITAMRAWASAELKPKAVMLDSALAAKLVRNGSVDIGHLKHAFQDPSDLSPIIICLKISADGADMIVDGNHRYVLACVTEQKYNTGGAAPGYVLSPPEWRPFVIDPALAAMNGVVPAMPVGLNPKGI
ncbi:hypothetical protein [Sandarakinorhabdus sp. DWP1-3-1]|uniref:hypothetical protein n=1 Tax=Sandarakinorhabdus sp. DWP1-3-1 TaxID=2804627 RepID=UPI003CFB5ED2